MQITFINIINIILIIIYSSLTIFVWKFFKRKNTNQYPQKNELIILLPTLIIHTISIWYVNIYYKYIILDLSHAFNLIVWITILMYWISSFYYNLQGLQIILFPLATLALITNVICPLEYNNQNNYNYLTLIHISLSIVANSLFAISTIFAILFIILDHELKKSKISPIMNFLPPLLSLEKISFQCTIIGFILLTITLISGTILPQYNFILNNKTIFSIISWIVYLIIIISKSYFSLRGKKLSWGIIIGFLFLFFTFITILMKTSIN